MTKRSKYFQIDGQLSFFDIIVPAFETYTSEEMFELFRSRDIKSYRAKTIRAGNMLECEIYPLLNSQASNRLKDKKLSREAQMKLNWNNTKKKIMRLTNHNFSSSDIWITLGYDDKHLPKDTETAYKNITNYIRRLKTLRKRKGLVALRYLYVTEWAHDGESVRCHHHVILSGDMSMDDAETAWKGGGYSQLRRLKVKHDCGLNGMAAYLAKGKSNEKRWHYSKNLVMPVPSVADKKITKRGAERIALNENDAQVKFEKLYPGYAFRSMEVKRSEYVARVYIYVQMYRKC